MANATKRPDTSANAVQGAVQPRFGEVRIRQRDRLPHWEKESGLHFVTFHLADSLPKLVLEKISARYRVLETTKRTGANVLPDRKMLVLVIVAGVLKGHDFSRAEKAAFKNWGFSPCRL
jgi:hypothetical protein